MKTALLLLSALLIVQAQNRLPQDPNGWTIFTPSGDTRIAYVSQSGGNDATAQTYAPGSATIGNDPFLPLGQIQAFKTIAAALKAVRDAKPDWVLLKRGDVWYESGGAKNGLSDSAPFLFSSYGPGTDRPLLKTGKEWGLSRCCKTARNFAVVGISFYAHTRDPDSPEYVSDSGSDGFNIYTDSVSTVKGVLIEDCMFRFYEGCVIQGPGTIADVVIRRNVIADNYSSHSHAQGLYTYNASLTLEENVFDHNGWYKQSVKGDNSQAQGQATMFNHNTYFGNSHDVLFRNNLFLRASSIGTKWTANSGPASARNITIENNLYVEGEIGISMGGNVPGPLRFKNIRIANNCMLDIGRARPTRRTLGWGLEIQEWDGGAVSGNLFLHNASDTVDNVYAINVNGSGGTRNVTIARNIVCGLKTGGSLVYFKDTLSGVSFSNNALQSQGIPARLVSTANSSGLSFSNNSYFSTKPAAQWFSIGGANADLAGWVTRSGETGAQGTAITYPDPGRTVELYHATLGKPGALAAFIAEARKQSKSNWRPEYTAAVINDWIRTGFGLNAAASPFHQTGRATRSVALKNRNPAAVYTVNGRVIGIFDLSRGTNTRLPSGLYLVRGESGALAKFLFHAAGALRQ